MSTEDLVDYLTTDILSKAESFRSHNLWHEVNLYFMYPVVLSGTYRKRYNGCNPPGNLALYLRKVQTSVIHVEVFNYICDERGDLV